MHSSRVPHDLAWDGCVNARDLGGFTTPAGTTAPGVFVRADNARKLTPRNVINQVVGDLEARGSIAAYLLQAGASAEELERIRRGFVSLRARRARPGA
jgi:hypothetical protein